MRDEPIPSIVLARADHEGDGGAGWAAGLPDALDRLAAAWGLRIERWIDGGSGSIVARVTRADGTRAVLKLSVPDPTFARRTDLLRRAAGIGYVRLLEVDEPAHAVLLEPLGGSVDRSGLPPERRLTALASVLRLAWRAPRASGPDGDPVDKAAGLHDLVERHALLRPDVCPAAVVDAALAIADLRSAAFDPSRCVVTHGDPAQPNLLDARPRAEFVFVDPDGFVGDPAYDLGVALRDWCGELAALGPTRTVEHYAGILSEASGMPARDILEWGFLERVSTGLYIAALGEDELARPHLDTAAALVRGE